jgi:hypothetical protein
VVTLENSECVLSNLNDIIIPNIDYLKVNGFSLKRRQCFNLTDIFSFNNQGIGMFLVFFFS